MPKSFNTCRDFDKKYHYVIQEQDLMSVGTAECLRLVDSFTTNKMKVSSTKFGGTEEKSKS